MFGEHLHRLAPPSSTEPHPGQPYDPLTRGRYRAVLFVVCLAAVVFFVAWLLNRPPGAEGVFNRYVLLPVSLFYMALGIFLWRRPDKVDAVAIIALVEIAIHLQARVILTLFVFQAGEDPRLRLAIFSPWTPVFIMGAFITMSRKWALRLSAAYVLVALVSVAVWMAQGTAPTRDPEIRYFLLHHFVFANGGYFGVAGVLMWIRQNHVRTAEQAQSLNRLAFTDPLTGLPNRRWAEEVLRVTLATEAAGTSVLLCDVDRFKDINDRHGHEAGDQVLTALGAALRSALRAGDAVGRWGGEEFVVIARSADEAGAEALAARLVQAVRTHNFPVVGQLSISVGVASSACNAQTPEALLRRADAALYRAKNEGRDRYCRAA